MKSVILAAGFATRLYPITEDKAKPLIEINKKPIINYIIDKIREISLEEIIIVTNDKFYPHFLEWMKKSNYSNITILNDGVCNPEKRLGAIGDLLFVIDKQKINEDLFLISGDNLFRYSLKEAYSIFQKERKDLSIFNDSEDWNIAKRMGVALIKDNFLIDFEEKPQKPKSTICSTSTYFFKKETIPLMKQFVNESKNADQPGLFLEYLYKKIPIYAYLTSERWVDVGTINSLRQSIFEFF